MLRFLLCVLVFSLLIAGCTAGTGTKNAVQSIVKVLDFELSPDEEKVTFSAITPVGNTDIWVVNIDGSNLKKLTFKDHSSSNHIALFFKKHKLRNFFTIDMRSPEWTKDGRIVFCQELTNYDIWGQHTVNLIYWSIKPDGTDRKRKKNLDDIVRRKPFNPIHSFELSDYSEKYRKKIFLKNNILWVLNDGEPDPEKLIR